MGPPWTVTVDSLMTVRSSYWSKAVESNMNVWWDHRGVGATVDRARRQQRERIMGTRGPRSLAAISKYDGIAVDRDN